MLRLESWSGINPKVGHWKLVEFSWASVIVFVVADEVCSDQLCFSRLIAVLD